MCKMGNLLDDVNDIFYIAEDNISKLEDITVEMIWNETQSVNRLFFFFQNKENICELWENFMWHTLH